MKQETFYRLLLHFLAYAEDKMSSAGCNEFPEIVELVPDPEERESIIRDVFDEEYEGRTTDPMDYEVVGLLIKRIEAMPA